MKYRLLSIFAVTLIFFSSCAKPEIDPVLEVYVTVKASEKYQNSVFDVSNVRFFQEIDGDEAISSLAAQNFGSPNIDLSLAGETTTLIYNDSYFDIEKLLGIHVVLHNLFISNADEGDFKVDVPWYSYGELDSSIAIENGKTYRMDITIDLDEQIFEEDGRKVLDNNFGLEVREL